MPPEKCKCKSLKLPESQRTNADATILHWEPEATSCLRCRTVQKNTNTNTMQMPMMLCYLTSANTNTMQMQMTMKIIESQSQVIASELLKYLQKQFTVFLLQKYFVFGDGEKSISADSLFLSLSTRGGR